MGGHSASDRPADWLPPGLLVPWVGMSGIAPKVLRLRFHEGTPPLREIGTIVDERQARALADYLLTLNITTKVEPNAAGFALWVHREERVAEARAALAEFTSNPADPRFQAAAKTAQALRKEREKLEAKHRKLSMDFRDRWEGAMYGRAPLAFGLILASIVVTALVTFRPIQTMDALGFSRITFEGLGDQEGVETDTGFDAIRSGEVWRLITPIFLHFGIWHILFNMIALRVFGERVEMRKGTWRFALLVVVSALVGNVGQFFLTGGGFGGMSGVVFALAGYLWVKGQVDPEDGLSLDNRSFQYMLIWFSLGFVAPILMPGVQGPLTNMANVAHGGGLAVGVLFGLLKF